MSAQAGLCQTLLLCRTWGRGAANTQLSFSCASYWTLGRQMHLEAAGKCNIPIFLNPNPDGCTHRAGSGAVLAAEPNSGLPHVRNKLILSLLICQIAYQVWEPLKVKIIVRGDGNYPGKPCSFSACPGTNGAQGTAVTIAPDLCSPDPSAWSC